MNEKELADIEARLRRYAADRDMPQSEWFALGVRLVAESYYLVSEVRRLRSGLQAIAGHRPNADAIEVGSFRELARAVLDGLTV